MSGLRLTVSDPAVAALVAHCAAARPGVARLAAPPARAAARQAVGRQAVGPGRRPDAAAVRVDRGPDGAISAVEVRVVATGTPPVLATVGAVQRAVRGELATMTGADVEVRVRVVDLDDA